jgi:hypothetical protein
MIRHRRESAIDRAPGTHMTYPLFGSAGSGSPVAGDPRRCAYEAHHGAVLTTALARCTAEPAQGGDRQSKHLPGTRSAGWQAVGSARGPRPPPIARRGRRWSGAIITSTPRLAHRLNSGPPRRPVRKISSPVFKYRQAGLRPVGKRPAGLASGRRCSSPGGKTPWSRALLRTFCALRDMAQRPRRKETW